MYTVEGIFVQGHMPVICIPVYLVILLMVVGSYEAFILQWVYVRNINWDWCLIYAHEYISICEIYGIWGHINFWHLHGTNNFIWHWSHVIPSPMACHGQKACCGTFQFILTYGMLWYHWCHHANTGLMESNDQKIYLDIRNVMRPSMMPFASWDTDANASGIAWPKSHVTCHFNGLYQGNAYVSLTIPLVSYDTDGSTNCVTWLKKSCCTSFCLSLSWECSDIIHDTIGIMSSWCQCK